MDLESIAGRPVDLEILNTDNLVYAKEAVSRGQIFYERDPAERRLGVPQSSAGAFTLLERAGLIDAELSKSLRGIAGFRNIAVHQYDEINMDILGWVVESGHLDFIKLGQALGVSIRP